MRRAVWAVVACTAVGGTALGVVATRSGSDSEAGRPAPTATTVPPSPTTAGPTTSSPAPAVPADVLLVWTPGGLPDGFSAAAALEPSLRSVSAIRGDELGLVASVDADGRPVDRPPPESVIPLDTVAVDPARLGAVLPAARAPLADLSPGQGLLGETSARLRGLGPGGVLTLEGGHTITVTGVIDDELVGAAELVLTQAGGERVGITTERYLLARHRGDRATAEAAIRDLVGTGTPTRVRAAGEVRFLRHADAVLPPALLKDALGEFAHRAGGGRDLAIDQAWVDEHITSTEVPVLGAVRCNRAVIPALEGAMAELEAQGLGGLVETYEGCFAPRRIRPGAPVSRHAWGGAIDVNFGTGRPGPQDPRLVEVMARWGFVSGDEFLVPDSGHFEYVAPPGG